MVGEISFARCALACNLSQGVDRSVMDALSVLRLIELNPHVKKLEIYEHENCYAFDACMFGYLANHCREVKEVSIITASAKAVRLAMESFPNLINRPEELPKRVDFKTFSQQCKLTTVSEH
jgi:hypothetical protein